MAQPSQDTINTIMKRIGTRIKRVFSGTTEENIGLQKKGAEWIKGILENFRKGKDLVPLDYVMKWPGTFYMFAYKSKLYYEGKIPWYDAFPLIFVLKIDTKGFLAMNFHWVHPKWRALALHQLMRSFRERFVLDKTLRPISYDLFLGMMGGYKQYMKPAVRYYLMKNVTKFKGIKFMRIKNMDMFNSILYVAPNFVGLNEAEAMRYYSKDKKAQARMRANAGGRGIKNPTSSPLTALPKFPK